MVNIYDVQSLNGSTISWTLRQLHTCTCTCIREFVQFVLPQDLSPGWNKVTGVRMHNEITLRDGVMNKKCSTYCTVGVHVHQVRQRAKESLHSKPCGNALTHMYMYVCMCTRGTRTWANERPSFDLSEWGTPFVPLTSWCNLSIDLVHNIVRKMFRKLVVYLWRPENSSCFSEGESEIYVC